MYEASAGPRRVFYGKSDSVSSGKSFEFEEATQTLSWKWRPFLFFHSWLYFTSFWTGEKIADGVLYVR